jgi:hypothetical protein
MNVNIVINGITDEKMFEVMVREFQSIKNIRDFWFLETRCMDNFVQMRKGNVSLPL